MKIKIIGSGSTGNAYALCSVDEILLIECGVHYKKIQQGINFEFSKIVGCLVTHEHNDHSKSAANLFRLGVNVMCSKGTKLQIGCGNVIEAGKVYHVGKFKVIPFDVPHDAAQPFGFFINHAESGNIVFITDAMYCKHNFKDVRHIMIESNYEESALMQNDLQYLRNRIRESHMSIDTCLDFVSRNSGNLETVILLHMSERNSNEILFRDRLQRLTGCRVYAAINNTEVTL